MRRRRYLVDKIQEVYRSQSVAINDKHCEVIVRQMIRSSPRFPPARDRPRGSALSHEAPVAPFLSVFGAVAGQPLLRLLLEVPDVEIAFPDKSSLRPSGKKRPAFSSASVSVKR